MTEPGRTVVARFTVPGEPVPKARARTTTHGTYTPERTVHAERVVAWTYWAAAGTTRPDLTGEYSVHAVFRLVHRRHRDTDNMLKLVLDALNGVAWVDDNQVVEVYARKELVPVDPGSHITVYRLDQPI